MLSREELEREAERVRSHLLSTAEELERKSGIHRMGEATGEGLGAEDDLESSTGAASRPGARTRSASGAASEPVSGSASGSTSAARSASTAAPKAEESDLETPERKRLERRADRVREHLADSIEALEKKARERLLPVVVTGGAVLVLLTVGYAWMFYRVMKMKR